MTVVSSKTREVHIDYDRPFCIIGERINPTGRKLLAEEMRRGDYSRVERDAVAQIKAGAQKGWEKAKAEGKKKLNEVFFTKLLKHI